MRACLPLSPCLSEEAFSTLWWARVLSLKFCMASWVLSLYILAYTNCLHLNAPCLQVKFLGKDEAFCARQPDKLWDGGKSWSWTSAVFYSFRECRLLQAQSSVCILIFMWAYSALKLADSFSYNRQQRRFLMSHSPSSTSSRNAATSSSDGYCSDVLTYMLLILT